jgi:hypothetical protein
VPLVSLRAYARHRGVTLHAVQKAIRSRRIELVDGRIDVDRADRDWARKTRPRRTPFTYSVPQDVDQTAVLRDGHLARLAEIECEERLRRLVDRSEVETAMLMVARRISLDLAREHNPAAIEALLVKEIRAVLAS